MEITKTFTVKAAPDAVWAFLTNPQRVAQSLPGAAIGEQLDEKTYTGTMTVKVGPVSSSYKGKVIFQRLDPTTRTAEIRATGQDVRGKGGADLQLTSSVRDLGGGQTEVTAVSQVNVSGLLAQMGRGMVQDVSDQIFQMFSDRMKAELETPTASGPEASPAAAPAAAPALDVVALGGTAARRAAGRLAQRPVFWVAIVILAALLWFLSRQ